MKQEFKINIIHQLPKLINIKVPSINNYKATLQLVHLHLSQLLILLSHRIISKKYYSLKII